MNAVAPTTGTPVHLDLWTLKVRCVHGGYAIQWAAWHEGGRSFSGPVEDWAPSNDPTVYASQAVATGALLRHLRARTPMGAPPD